MLSELHVPFLWGNFFLLAPKGIVIMMGVFSFSKNWVIARRFLKRNYVPQNQHICAILCRCMPIYLLSKNFMLNTLKNTNKFQRSKCQTYLQIYFIDFPIEGSQKIIFLRLIILNSIKTTPVEVVVQSSIDKWFRRPTTFLRTFH